MVYLLNIINDLTKQDIILIILVLTLLIITIILLSYIKILKNNNLQNKDITDLEKEIDNKDATMELTNLQEDVKELEQKAKEHEVKMTPYEEEQEEKAIISYDELLKRSSNVSIGYSSFSNEDDVLVKQVDLNNTGKIELDPIQKEINSKVRIINYEHEEAFLNALKELKNMLN